MQMSSKIYVRRVDNRDYGEKQCSGVDGGGHLEKLKARRGGADVRHKCRPVRSMCTSRQKNFAEDGRLFEKSVWRRRDNSVNRREEIAKIKRESGLSLPSLWRIMQVSKVYIMPQEA